LVLVNLNAGGLDAAETKTIIAQADFERVTQRSQTDDLDFLAFEQSHLHETLDKRVATLDGRYAALLTGT
jgi:hypothetical protein